MESAHILNLGMSKFNKEYKKWVLIGKNKHKNTLIWDLKLPKLTITEVSSIKFMDKEQHIVSHTSGCPSGQGRLEIPVLEL